MSSNTKILGIPVSAQNTAFNLLKGLGIETEYIDPLFMNTVTDSILEIEEKASKKGKSKEYLNGEYNNTINNQVTEDMKEVALIYGNDLKNATYFCLSACDADHLSLKSISKYLSENYPNKPQILGGPIAREGTMPFLKNNNINYLNTGGMSSLIEFLNGNKNAHGLYTKKESEFYGNGTGTLPKIDENILIRGGIVDSGEEIILEETAEDNILHTGDTTISASIFTLSTCSNNCDYCSTPKQARIPEDVYIKAINRIKQDEKKITLRFYDDNPLTNPLPYMEIINHACQNFETVNINNLYIDPTALSQSYNARKFIKKLINNAKIESITPTFGRECCDEKITIHLGRNYKNNPRTQEILDKEREIIIEFIQNDKVEYGLIGYILAPEETPETIENRLNEISTLSSCNENIETMTQTLKANIGTRTYEKYKHLIISPFPGRDISNIDAPHFRVFERSSFKHENSPNTLYSKALEKTADILASQN
ncbi:MAG: hypothetical protein DRN71_02535 [Candidatus Nanohalarchaeota archaeon]|nr:MAG: hypothetical protein DRN71_02535 [Candidatus Nanohaloarchaeota archaeon]